MPATNPVIIVGAPRSGTSLMQKLIREVPGFVSVPKESDMIWLPHCHPATNDWQFEGCPDERITPELVATIRNDFQSQALSAATWRLFDRLGLMERPRLAASLRLAYRTLFKPWKRIREKTASRHEAPGRLVDKSVHAGLWLNLVDAVFPDALYIHMVRSPETCVPSMIRGWQAPDRFKTYRIPDRLVSNNADTGWWCFPMPSGWQRHHTGDIVDTCTFQWNTINNSICQHWSDADVSHRVLRIHLEELTTTPDRIIQRLVRFLNIPESLLRLDATGTLPVINASRNTEPPDESVIEKIHCQTSATYANLTT